MHISSTQQSIALICTHRYHHAKVVLCHQHCLSALHPLTRWQYGVDQGHLYKSYRFEIHELQLFVYKGGTCKCFCTRKTWPIYHLMGFHALSLLMHYRTAHIIYTMKHYTYMHSPSPSPKGGAVSSRHQHRLSALYPLTRWQYMYGMQKCMCQGCTYITSILKCMHITVLTSVILWVCMIHS